MFSKSKITDPIEPRNQSDNRSSETPQSAAAEPRRAAMTTAARPAGGSSVSIISSDLKVIGNLETAGDLQIEGIVEGDVRANTLIIGPTADVRGQIVADDVVVNGKVNGRIRGLKVRLAETAQVDGDILHSSIAIEAGARFQGSVNMSDDPLETNKSSPARSTITELTASTITAAAAQEKTPK